MHNLAHMLPAIDEQVQISHRQSEQILNVNHKDYLAGRNSYYRNWKLVGDSISLRPPVLLSAFLYAPA